MARELQVTTCALRMPTSQRPQKAHSHKIEFASAGNLIQWKIIDPNKRVYVWALVAKTVKNLPAVQETQVQSLGWEDPLEKRMATHSSIIAWRIPWTEEPGRLQSMGSQKVRRN